MNPTFRANPNAFKVKIRTDYDHLTHLKGPFEDETTLCGIHYTDGPGDSLWRVSRHGKINCEKCEKIVLLCRSIKASSLASLEPDPVQSEKKAKRLEKARAVMAEIRRKKKLESGNPI